MSFVQPYALTDFDPGTHYIGRLLDPGWKVSIMHSCMDGILEECNFKVFLERLGGESETVKIERVGFSGDGWYEFVAINTSDTQAIDKAAEMLSALRDHPILDEARFTEAEESYYGSIGYVQDDGGDWVPQEEALSGDALSVK